MKNLKQQIDQFILDNIDLHASELVVLIKEKFGEQYTESGIRTKKHRLQKSNSEMELNPVTAIEQENKPKYFIYLLSQFSRILMVAYLKKRKV